MLSFPITQSKRSLSLSISHALSLFWFFFHSLRILQRQTAEKITPRFADKRERRLSNASVSNEKSGNGGGEFLSPPRDKNFSKRKLFQRLSTVGASSQDEKRSHLSRFLFCCAVCRVKERKKDRKNEGRFPPDCVAYCCCFAQPPGVWCEDEAKRLTGNRRKTNTIALRESVSKSSDVNWADPKPKPIFRTTLSLSQRTHLGQFSFSS